MEHLLSYRSVAYQSKTITSPEGKPMGRLKSLALASAFSMLSLTAFAWSQTSAEVPPSLITPDKVETRLGPLEFKSGAPSAETLSKIYDNLDFTHAFDALLNTFQGVNMAAIHKGFLSIGVKDNELLIFSELMDASSLFLTANADTVYFLGCIDLSNGPMVLEAPRKALGTLDDFWWRWVIDFGAPGPDRGEGASICCCRPVMMGHCLRAAFISPVPAPRAWWFSGAASWKTTTRSPRSI
jgi:hypothetical protein